MTFTHETIDLAGESERHEATPRTRAAAEAVIVLSAYLAYSAMRVVVEGTRSQAMSNAERVLDFERSLGIDVERDVQHWVVTRAGWTEFWNGVYQWGYLPTVIGALILLWRSDRGRYLLLRNTLLLSAAIGVIIFAAFPVAPPRFLDGYVDTLAEHGTRLFGSDRSSLINEFAAVPSFHVAWPAVAGVMIARGSGRTLVKVAAMIPATLLIAAVVVTGNHFVFDVAVGLLVVTVAASVASRVARTEQRTPVGALQLQS